MMLLPVGLPVRQLQDQQHSPGGRLGQSTQNALAMLSWEVHVPARSLATLKAYLAAVPVQEMAAAVMSQVKLQGSSAVPL
mmetsp:Transcript_18404/g.55475  ORF Transcript_18404/g.55475 Transcript_18404/m.55475 type:complete len:80 (-) Transcript_18404:11943-12182(-)